ncbi:MAG: response regulator [Treponema sp.]|nr:MAG: response regulator [Treponema sp.]
MKKVKADDPLSDRYYSEILLELSTDFVVFVTPENTIARMSRVARDFLNLADDFDFQGKNLFSLIRNPVLTLLARTWLEKLDNGMSVDETFPLDPTGNGSYEWFQVKASNALQDGVVKGRVVFITKITTLQSYRKILETLLASNPAEIIVFDRHYKILVASDKVAQENGYQTWRDLAGRSLRELPGIDVAIIEAMLDSVILTDGPVQRVSKTSSAGSRLRWGHLDLRCIKSSAGVFGYMLSQFDITEEIRPKAVLEALMESTKEIILIVGPDEKIEFVSRALTDIVHITNPITVLHQHWSLLFRHADPDIRTLVSGFGKGRKYEPAGTFQYRKGEEVAYCSYRIEELTYHNENFGRIVIATDATELVSARETAEAAVQAKAAFLANMSHELRTPMNAVLGMNELLARSGLTPLQRNYVSQIRTSASMLLSIINDILDFSKLEDKQLVLVSAVYSLESLLRDVVNMIAVKTAEKELSFTVDVDPRLPLYLEGDILRIKQILINLLNNAVKFTDQGEVNLTVSGSRVAGSRVAGGTVAGGTVAGGRSVVLCFAVRDTGVGIPKERQSELFNRFARIENNRTRMVEGSGLGLAICRNLVQLMNGSLSLESEEGAGSVFTASITQNVSDKPEPYCRFPEPGGLLLVVFIQEPGVRRSVCKMAEYSGTAVELCSSVEAFRARLESGERPATHAVFDYRRAYEEAVIVSRTRPDMRFLALLSLTDFVGTGKDALVDFVFKPLGIATFARFLQGERVDFSSTIPLVNTLGFDPKQFRVAGVTILVVDDSAVNRKVVEGFLQALDIRVLEAESGQEALGLAEKQRFDLIFMDHVMPGMDGPETTKKIRAMEGCSDIPIVALTANVGEAYQEMYRNAGMNDYLYKPIEFSAFLECLKRWLPGQRERTAAPGGPAATTEASAAGTDAGGAKGATAAGADVEVSQAASVETGWIPGLDRNSGISYTGSPGNLDMILAVFNRTAGKMLQKLDEGKESGDAEAFRAAAHSLISSCANIGGVDISARSRELEQAVIAGNTAEAERLYPIVREELVQIIAGVSRYLEGK